jgi:hypothetical protein
VEPIEKLLNNDKPNFQFNFDSSWIENKRSSFSTVSKCKILISNNFSKKRALPKRRNADCGKKFNLKGGKKFAALRRFLQNYLQKNAEIIY